MDSLRKCLILVFIFSLFFVFDSAWASSLIHVSDKISTSEPSAGADHTIEFEVVKPVPGAGRIVITPEAGFYLPDELNYTDLDFIVGGAQEDLGDSAATSTSGVQTISGYSPQITITLADDLDIFSGTGVVVKVGTGDKQISNPSVNGSYKINIKTFDNSNLLDRADAMVAILSPIQVGLKMEVIAYCGNGVVEGDEQCDGSDLAGETCVSQGYDGGTLSCKADCTFDTSDCYTEAAPAPGAPAPAPVVPTKVILEGWAYPKSKVTALKDGKIVDSVYANAEAEFSVEIPDITPGTYTFGIWAEDTDGRKSTTYSLTFYVRADTATRVSGIFLPPTIDLSKAALLRGEILDIFGQTVPESEVEIRVYSPAEEITEKTKANEIGVWLIPFNTQPLEEGRHAVKARSQISAERVSNFGHLLDFFIGVTCPRADLNQDGKTDIADYSILMYYWGTDDLCADQNQDGIVNIADFSIMMSWWGKVVELCPKADLNQDGKTNLVDFSILLYRWGTDDPCADQNQNGVVDLPDFSIMLYYWTG